MSEAEARLIFLWYTLCTPSSGYRLLAVKSYLNNTTHQTLRLHNGAQSNALEISKKTTTYE